MPNLERYLVAAIVAIVLLILGLTIFGNLESVSDPVEPGANSLATPLEPPGPPTGASPLRRGEGAAPVVVPSTQVAQADPSAATHVNEPVALNATHRSGVPGLPRGIGDGGPIPYEAKPGDTFASIARTFYGTAKLGSEIRKMNEDLDPFEIAPGTRIYVPKLTRDEVQSVLGIVPGATGNSLDDAVAAGMPGAAQAATESGAPATPAAPAARGSTYEVKPGDTLSEISQKLYGTSKRWRDLLELNADLLEDPRDLQVGMKLKLLPLEAATSSGG